MDAITQVPAPTNEPILDYEPGTAARARLEVVDRLVDGNGHLGDGIHEGSSRVGRGG